MSHIFIGYSHKDKEYVHKLRDALRERGFDAWIDEDIAYSYGTPRWVREIEKHLQQCSIFLLVMSPDAHESDWVEKELLTAFKLKKPIATLLLAGEAWLSVQNILYEDVTNGNLPPESFFLNLARHQITSHLDAQKNEHHIIMGDVNNSTIVVGNANSVKNENVVSLPEKNQIEPTFLLSMVKDEPTELGAPPDLHPQKTEEPKLRTMTNNVESHLTESRPTSSNVVPRPTNISQTPAAKTAITTHNPTRIVIILGASIILLSLISIAGIWGMSNSSKNNPTLTVITTGKESAILPTTTFTPKPESLDTTIHPIETIQKGAAMRLIPAGSFTMGSDNGAYNEKPPHSITIASFYMDQYETSNLLYKACVNAKGCTAPLNNSSFTRLSYYGNNAFDNYPVVYVDWRQAKTYCEWRGARLPTEAEWEYAARGPSAGLSASRTYPWGESIDNTYANYDQTMGDTTLVNSYETGKNDFGLYNMAGNVWEWVYDWYDETYYQSSPSNNPQGPSTGQYRVLRGGGWYDFGNLVRSAVRFRFEPIFASYIIGFRCARSP